MGFPNAYREIAEMIVKEALQTRTARAIMRKAGLSPAGITSVVPTTSPFGPLGLLLHAANWAPQALASETAIRYDEVGVNGGGFTFTPGQTSFSAHEAGLYRATATLALVHPSSPDEGFFGHGLRSAGGEWAVMEAKHYIPPTTVTPYPLFVLGGTALLALEAGESASHTFYAEFGSLPTVSQDPEATRMYVERVA